jgi:hypothetical protein
VLLLLLVMLLVTKPLLCMPREDRVTLPDPAAVPRLLPLLVLWLADCCRSLPLLLCPDAAGGLLLAVALLPMDPDGAVIALAMLLQSA